MFSVCLCVCLFRLGVCPPTEHPRPNYEQGLAPPPFLCSPPVTGTTMTVLEVRWMGTLLGEISFLVAAGPPGPEEFLPVGWCAPTPRGSHPEPPFAWPAAGGARGLTAVAQWDPAIWPVRDWAPFGISPSGVRASGALGHPNVCPTCVPMILGASG